MTTTYHNTNRLQMGEWGARALHIVQSLAGGLVSGIEPHVLNIHVANPEVYGLYQTPKEKAPDQE